MISGAVEGDLDEAVLRRLANHVGLHIGTVYGRKGKPHLLSSLAGYNAAAKHVFWIVLVDLDSDCDCAPVCRHQWLPQPNSKMSFRIAVRAIEAWLLADRERIANLLRIKTALVTQYPDQLTDPKAELIALASRSRRRQVQEDYVPEAGSGRKVGKLYTGNLIEFVQSEEGWRPEIAQTNSESLARCMADLAKLA